MTGQFGSAVGCVAFLLAPVLFGCGSDESSSSSGGGTTAGSGGSGGTGGAVGTGGSGAASGHGGAGGSGGMGGAPVTDPCANDDESPRDGPVFFVASTASGDGTAWDAAWPDVTAIDWGAVTPGSTICLAGGSYGELLIEANGTASGRICIRRAAADDPQCGDATPGWSGAFDAQVVLTGVGVPSGNGSYVTIDGRVPYAGIQIFDSSVGESYTVSLPSSTADYFRLFNVDVAGVATESTDFTGDGRCFHAVAQSTTHGLHIAYSQFHGKPTLFLTSGNQDVVFEHNRLFDNVVGNPAQWHPNVWASLENEVNVTWRYNVVTNWMTEGIMMCFVGPGCVPNSDWHIYGNVWAHGNRVLEAQYEELGRMYLYNNTFVDLSMGVTGSQGNGGAFSGGTAQNNLLWQAAADWEGWGISDAGNLEVTADEFLDSGAGDFHLSPGASAIDAGQPVTALPNHTFDTDPDGTKRGADGAWDMGAYEYP